MTTTSPAALGFSAERLARIDGFLAERYVGPGLLPCALLAVAREGRVVHQSVLGHASLERGQPLAEDTIFRIYSMTKPITSVAFMMLPDPAHSLEQLSDPTRAADDGESGDRRVEGLRRICTGLAGGSAMPR